MFQRILVPLDGSAHAEQALPVAARVARASGGSVVLLQMVNPPVDFWLSLTQVPLVTEQMIATDLAEAKSYLCVLAKSHELAGIQIHTEVALGVPTQQILIVAQSRRADLIVMCSHGRTGFSRWALDSTVPVLVLREGAAVSLLPRSNEPRTLRALVPLDGSPGGAPGCRPGSPGPRLVTI